jgi:hypothetical protein
MTRTLGVVPPDHPMFSAGPSLVFKEEEPLDTTPAGDDDSSTQPSESEDE